MSRFKTLTAGLFVSSVAFLALSGTALADTGSTVTVGPIPVPAAPVQVCVTHNDIPGGLNKCVTTPPAQSVTLVVNVQAATPAASVVPPTATPISCPNGTKGAAVQVTTGSASAAISGSATVTLNDGQSITVPINPVIETPNHTATVFACAGVTPGA